MAKDAKTRPESAADHPLKVLVVETAGFEEVMASCELCGPGISAPVNTPSPKSVAHSMAWISAACEVGHNRFLLRAQDVQ